MTSSKTSDAFLALVRLGIGHGFSDCSENVDWPAVKALADQHGLSAIVLDAIDKCHTEKANTNHSNCTNSLSLDMKLEWIGEVLQEYEQRYEQYKQVIADLAGWHHAHGFKMMVLKGYACSLDWPKPEHRPCGDIDIWQFGKQKEADAALLSLNENQNENENHNKIEIDESHHHHTVFEWNGFTVENHYDFLNVHHHKSNVELEAILKDLGKDDTHSVMLNGEKVYLPSPNLHALFLLRHSMSNFASTGMRLRQLLDWGFFVKRHGEEVDWPWLVDVLDRFGMKRLFLLFNAICVDDLGFDAEMFPTIPLTSSTSDATQDSSSELGSPSLLPQLLPALKDRVLNDIISPEFSEKENGGFVRRAVFKYRRWRANAWKHELCFKESLWSAFWSGVKSHLLKPSSI